MDPPIDRILLLIFFNFVSSKHDNKQDIYTIT